MIYDYNVIVIFITILIIIMNYCRELCHQWIQIILINYETLLDYWTDLMRLKKAEKIEITRSSTANKHIKRGKKQTFGSIVHQLSDTLLKSSSTT